MFSAILCQICLTLMKRDWSKLHQESYIIDYISYDWYDTLNKEEQNIDYSMNIFLNNTNTLLGNYALLKKKPLNTS